MTRLACWHGVQILPGHAPIHRCKDCEAQSAIDERDQRFLWLYPLKGARVAIKLHPAYGEKIPEAQDLQWKPGEFEEAWKNANRGGFRPLIIYDPTVVADFWKLYQGIRARVGSTLRIRLPKDFTVKQTSKLTPSND